MNSDFLRLNLRDLGHGLIVAVIGAVLAGLASAVQAGDWPEWHAVLGMAAVAGVSYLGKQFKTNSQGGLGPEKPPPAWRKAAAVLLLLAAASPASAQCPCGPACACSPCFCPQTRSAFS